MASDGAPDKPYYRIGEVSRLTGVKPYVLRYWESEFPTVAPIKTRTNQRLYRREDVEQILAIKRLLYTERYTIAGARAKLEAALAGQGGPGGTAAEDDVERLRRLLQRLRDELQSLRALVE
ncbi:MAG TPA: MerR family transcriptional regulator [Thermodesulfobacteriota bacterium]|nr:MerR family transcriptional regulator [Thermodesulfobacteriota bacterium]